MTTSGCSSEEEEKLVQMVIDFFESDSSPKSDPNPTHPSYSCNYINPTSLSTLQDILKEEEALVGEKEVLEKVLFYLQNIDFEEDMVEKRKKIDSLNKWIVLRLKMDHLDASLCKTSWLSTFPLSLSSGDYEYVDVILKDRTRTRIIVDIDFVGTEEKLNKIISLLCAAAKQSLKDKGLQLPPWRKSTYMHSKWHSHNCYKLSLVPPMPKLLSLD